MIKRGVPGTELRLLQWANDWITAQAPGGRQIVLSPLQVQLTPAEVDRMHASMHEAHLGQFWQAWSLDPRTGRFTSVMKGSRTT